MTNRDAEFAAIVAEGHAAGMAAAATITPEPMIVIDTLSGKVYEPIADGVCGFGWIWFKGNTAFGRWAKKTGVAGTGYPNGLTIWIRDHRQSLTLKAAHARAFAAVLGTHGITAYGQSRID